MIYEKIGFTQDEVKIMIPVTLIVISAVLTALGVFDKIAYYAGAGTIVPITGFANAVVSPAMEFQSEGKILGTGANMFKIAGPVIVYGVLAAVIYGIVYYIFLR
jgi:stage V sporulation protein AC